MDFIYSIVGFFVTGGPFMYPILIVFAVGTAIAVERLHHVDDGDCQEPECVEQGPARTHER